MESNAITECSTTEMKELVKIHIEENRMHRETYLKLLQELDKSLDSLNKKLENRITDRARVDPELNEGVVENDQVCHGKIIDLSFLPLTNVDDLDDLEEKLNADYDYKQNMVRKQQKILSVQLSIIFTDRIS